MIDSVADCFRLGNGALAVACIVLLLFDRHKVATMRLFVTALIGIFAWQAFTSIEVVALSTPESTTGVRVYGFTFFYTVALVALIIERVRQGKGCGHGV